MSDYDDDDDDIDLGIILTNLILAVGKVGDAVEQLARRMPDNDEVSDIIGKVEESREALQEVVAAMMEEGEE